MKAYQITNLKTFTRLLFSEDTFDSFLFREAAFQTASGIYLEGKRNQAFYSEEDKKTLSNPEYLTWGEIRPLAFQILRGKRLPVSFKITLLHPDRLPALDRVCNIRYEQEQLLCITGTSSSSFSLDRQPEKDWDKAFGAWMQEKQISFEEAG